MRIEFTNSLGKIVFGTGDMRIIEIDGTGLAPKVRNTVNYAGIVGQNKLSDTVGARTVTIKGDLKSSSPQSILTRMMRILDTSGTLILRVGAKGRRIAAECVEFDISDRNGVYQPFILQFICDYPYFSDITQTEIYIFKVQNLLKTQFTLPCMFSQRECKQNIYNSGDVVCEPIFEFTALSDGAEDGSITIENETTAQQITLNYRMSAGEVITVDIESRKITSDTAGDIIYSLDDDSYLSDFWLDKGNNSIVVTNGSGGEMKAVCAFSNKYIEAVV